MPRVYSADQFQRLLCQYKGTMVNLRSLDGQLKLRFMKKKLRMLRVWDKRGIAWEPNIDRTGYYPNLVDVQTDIVFWAMEHCYHISLVIAQLDFFGIFLDIIVGLLLGIGVYYGYDPIYIDPSLLNPTLDVNVITPSSDTQDTVSTPNTSKSDDTINWTLACCAVALFTVLMISGHASYIK